MFCPHCKAEYDEGISVCVDCKINLINELPPEEERPAQIEMKNDHLVKVLKSYGIIDRGIIKSILDAENIPYFFEEGSFYMPGRAATLMVNVENVNKVKELLKEVELHNSVFTDDKNT